jgi:N-acetyl-gamma-glutamyl-phosphate reductase
VRGTNNVFINVFEDRVPGRAIIISAIDNLVKVRHVISCPL